MYRQKSFRLRPLAEVIEDFRLARAHYKYVERIFLADGDALSMSNDKLLSILKPAMEILPECQQISAYARPSQILAKSEEELKALLDAGLKLLYIGAESGSDEVLRRVDKGETAAEIIQSVQKAEGVGIQTSITLISGLGGKELMAEHAIETGKLISAMGATYVGLLTLMLEPPAPLYDDMRSGKFVPLSPAEVVDELELILSHADCQKDCVLRSNHASNLIILKGTLPGDKEKLLAQVREAKTDGSLARGLRRPRSL